MFYFSPFILPVQDFFCTILTSDFFPIAKTQTRKRDDENRDWVTDRSVSQLLVRPLAADVHHTPLFPPQTALMAFSLLSETLRGESGFYICWIKCTFTRFIAENLCIKFARDYKTE